MKRFFAKHALLLSLFTPYITYAENSPQTRQSGTLPSYFVWSYGISSQVDVAPFQDLLNFMTTTNPAAKNCILHSPYTDIEREKLVWLHPTMLSNFVQQILPALREPIFLIVNNSDHAFPSVLTLEERSYLINHPYIAHIFAQNCDLIGPHKKLTQIPLGLDYHSGVKNGESIEYQERQLMDILRSSLPTHQRIQKIFVDFQHHDTSLQRKNIFSRILRSGLVDYFSEWVDRETLWRKKSQYAFSISPHGNGLDCHRTWEDLILGCIVIVKTSSLDELYRGLPVVIVQDWEEICPENLKVWLEQYGDAFTNPKFRQKLTNRYWVERIKSIMRDSKN